MHEPHQPLYSMARALEHVAGLGERELRELIATEREQGRAFSPIADAARVRLEQLTGRRA